MLPKRNLAPVAVVTLGGFGLYTLTGDAVAQARDPLTPKDDHDSADGHDDYQRYRYGDPEHCDRRAH